MKPLALAVCLFLLSSIPAGCYRPLDRDTYPDREWSEAWDCRCDTCCETLARIERSQGK